MDKAPHPSTVEYAMLPGLSPETRDILTDDLQTTFRTLQMDAVPTNDTLMTTLGNREAGASIAITYQPATDTLHGKVHIAHGRALQSTGRDIVDPLWSGVGDNSDLMAAMGHIPALQQSSIMDRGAIENETLFTALAGLPSTKQRRERSWTLDAATMGLLPEESIAVQAVLSWVTVHKKHRPPQEAMRLFVEKRGIVQDTPVRQASLLAVSGDELFATTSMSPTGYDYLRHHPDGFADEMIAVLSLLHRYGPTTLVV